MPAGAPSSFQAYEPWPIVVKHAAGSRMIDVDDNEYVDYDMGFGYWLPIVRAVARGHWEA
jgi:glutamate-1-semialdehyde 2,1-aminomutase